MPIKLISLTLNTANLTDQIEFFKGLGFELEPIKISKGGEFYRARLEHLNYGFQINLFGLQDKINTVRPSLQLCYTVTELDETFSRITKVKGVTTLLEPTEMPDGRKAIIKDPDGNSIEIVQLK